MLSAETQPVPPEPSESVFRTQVACTLRSVLQALDAGSESIERTVKKGVWL